MREINQTPTFARRYKKLQQNIKKELNVAIREIVDSPEIGVLKKGELKEFRIHKSKINSTEYLIAYRIVSDTIQLVDLGTHENFYRDLKRRLQN